MRERNKENQQSSKSCFLERFSGKLNVITKHGQIRDESSLKLPVINSPQSKRANTMKFRSSKQSMHSFFSQGRSVTSKSSIQKSRAHKYLTHNIDREFTDVSNHFMKHPLTQTLKKSANRHTLIQPLSAVPMSKKATVNKEMDSRKQQGNNGIHRIQSHNNRNYDYETFLNQLHSVSSILKSKKGQTHFQANDTTNLNN